MGIISSVGILVFDQVELLDFAGPLQVFSAARAIDPEKVKLVETVSLINPVSVAKCDLKVWTTKNIREVQGYEILLIPGGMGTRSILKDNEQLDIINEQIRQSKITTSVCTGSLILASLGYLKGKKATTHFGAIELLQKLDPSIDVDRSRRFHDHGKIVVSEGVSAGIDMSFHLLDKYVDKEFSEEVRRYIEYYPEKN